MERDYYQVLGLARTATPAEVRAAYARLVRRHHPDDGGDLPDRLRDVQAAYRCLVDPRARADHDRRIAESERVHLARQQRVQRRLGRYDRRRAVAPRQIDPRRRWRVALIAAIGAAVVARLSLGLF